MLTWDPPDERYYEHGLDRGVLYIPGKDAVPWSGLTGFEEGSEGSSSLLYRDGVVYLADAEASDFTGKMDALFFPNEFAECIGIPEVTDGFYVDNQKPKRFSLSYRSLIGSGAVGDLFGYQIHLAYNCMATIAPRSRKTLGGDNESVMFSFNISCTPVKLPGYRPTAHYIIDTRHLSSGQISDIETLLYGDSDTPGRMPTPTELFDLLNFGDAITFTSFTHPVLGLCWTASGSYANVHMTGPDTWEILNVNGVNHGDGTYTLSDTP